MGTKYEVKNTGVVDFKQSGTENLVLEQGAVTPVSGVEGQLFYRTDTDQHLIHDGTDFKALLGGSFRIYSELVNETPNGVLVAFTVDNPYVAQTTEVTRDGLRMERGIDYTESNSGTGEITFTTAPATSSIILVSYSRVEGSSLPLMNKFDVVTGVVKQTYTGSTTVFDLPFAYTPGAGSLIVWSGGALMLEGASNDYVETDNNTITFNSARTASEIIQFIKIGAANDQATSGWVDAGGSVTPTTSTDQVVLPKTTNQIVFGSTNTITLNATAPSSSLTLTIPDPGTNASFVMTEGSQSISGAKTFNSPILLANGTELLPAFSFATDPDTGIYRSAASTLSVSTGGVQRLQIDGNFRIATGQIKVPDGSNALPTYAFSSDLDTGMYLGATGQIELATSGTKRLTVRDGAVEVSNAPLQMNTNKITGLGDGTADADAVNRSQLNLVLPLLSYRRPVLQYVDSTFVDVENNTGTANETKIIFPDGDERKVVESVTGSIHKYRRFHSTDTASLVATHDSGLRSGETLSANTWYALYAVKTTDDSSKFVIVGTTTLPIQSNFSTLNGYFGTNGWVYLGLIRRGDNSSVTTDIVKFKQSGNRTSFGNSCVTGGSASPIGGLRLAFNAAAYVLSWTYSGGSGTFQIPPNVGQIEYLLMQAASTATVLQVYDSSGTIRFKEAPGRLHTSVLDPKLGVHIVQTNPGSANMTIHCLGFIDSVLGVGSNPVI